MAKERVTRTLFAISRTIYLGLGPAYIGIGLFGIIRAHPQGLGPYFAIGIGALGLAGTLLQPHRLVLAAALRASASLGLCLVAISAFFQDFDFKLLPLYATAPTLLIISVADFSQMRSSAAESAQDRSPDCP